VADFPGVITVIEAGECHGQLCKPSYLRQFLREKEEFILFFSSLALFA